jgi:hypothetical protein
MVAEVMMMVMPKKWDRNFVITLERNAFNRVKTR